MLAIGSGPGGGDRRHGGDDGGAGPVPRSRHDRWGAALCVCGALLGGIPGPVGAIVGGLIVGVTENLVGTYLIASQLELTWRLP